MASRGGSRPATRFTHLTGLSVDSCAAQNEALAAMPAATHNDIATGEINNSRSFMSHLTQ